MLVVLASNLLEVKSTKNGKASPLVANTFAVLKCSEQHKTNANPTMVYILALSNPLYPVPLVFWQQWCQCLQLYSSIHIQAAHKVELMGKFM